MSKSSLRRFAVAALAALVCVVASGCAFTRGTGPNTVLRVSGPAGTSFTARYQTDAGMGDMTTSIGDNGRATPFDFPGRPVRCEVTRPRTEVEVGAELSRGGQTVYRTAIPAGRRGVRITEGASGFDVEVF